MPTNSHTPPTNEDLITERRRAEFVRLFKEFASDYPATKAGQQHAASYDAGREQARANYAVITAAADRGEDVTDQVLLKLLPHVNTRPNRDRGAWIHVAPAVTKDIKIWFQGAGWTKPEDWPQVAQTILTFIRQCVEMPAELVPACEAFAASPVTRGLQTGMLTPILSALRPDDFVLINNKSRALLNHFTDRNFSQKLTDYPAANTTLQQLLEVLADEMAVPGVPNLRPADLFDMFSHWLVAIKKYFKNVIDELEDDGKLAEPFAWLFADRQEAEWALDLMAETMRGLGIAGADDARMAVTLRRARRQYHLHLDFGNWLVVCFAGKNGHLTEIQLALLDEPIDVASLSEAQFAQPQGEPQVWLKTFKAEALRPFTGEFRAVFQRTVAYLAQRFRSWRRSPFNRYSLSNAVAAILNPEQRDTLLIEGAAVDVTSGEDDVEVSIVQYWKIAPGEKAWNWPDCQRDGYIGIGWEELGDLTGLSREQFEEQRAAAFERHEGWTEDAVEQVWRFAQIKIGDRIVANRGTTEVLGIGTVTGPYFYLPGERHGHRLPVHWDDVRPRQVNEGGWRKTLIELDRLKFEAILAQHAATEPVSMSEPPMLQPDYSLDQCAEDTNLDPALLSQWVRAIERKRQAIFYGPPGTGKTYLAEHLARHLIGGGDGFFEFVQFHPAYAYEDFIQGIRPQRIDGRLDYPIVPGRFLEFCRRAATCSGLCVLIIDEINRANLARVFGELMYLLEYRDREVPLAGGGTLKVPDNVRVIGTMNTADRSIALVDHALRRRFAFIALHPDFDALRRYHLATGFDATGLINLLDRLNQQIGDPHYAVGISYFLHPQLADHLADIWRMEIEPYLEEYFFDQPGKVDEFRWTKIASSVSP